MSLKVSSGKILYSLYIVSISGIITFVSSPLSSTKSFSNSSKSSLSPPTTYWESFFSQSLP
ncbi:hypothetical protein [African swine fever virus]|uniref:Uncharacterized protein n=1 Tax=African swine fever virus TaxID=10497 RepID=A0A3G1EV54_ASF|nr:hypothetical protein F8221_gp132 [African swine fever virus]AOO54437.1 hypothetical protein AFSV47Ss_0132 [African swine fever virus]QID21263.1 hypothetical protein AFSV47Ss_0132 [African swine fever virus]QIM06773.1 hypothetical protein [African swine fever virus]QIM07008.1 hypothetical protein [African swine fever virus]QIM07243.1 hypothetical protein [African swine fever virus]